MPRPRSLRLRLALVTATAAISVLALGAATAGAAAGPGVWAGSADALALDLRITAPEGLLAPVTGGASSLVQTVALTTTALDSSDEVATSTVLLDGLVRQGALANDGRSSSDRTAIAAQEVAGVVHVGAGTTEYVADTAGDLARSTSRLSDLRVTVAPLFAGGVLPEEVAAPVQEAVQTATETINGLVGELNGALDQVETALNDVAGQAPVDLPEIRPEELPSVPDVTSVDLITVRDMWSESVVTTEADLVRSTATGGVSEVSLMGGLVVVPALEYRSVAQTAGVAGTAAASTDITTIAVRVGGQEVRVSGTTLSVGDVVVDLAAPGLEGVPVAEVLGPVEEVLASLLNAGGLSIAQGSGVTDVAEDGSSASASTTAFALSLAPLHAAGQDDVLRIDLSLLPTSAAVSGAPAAIAAGEPASLPRTGGGSIAVALGLLAGAALASRTRVAA